MEKRRAMWHCRRRGKCCIVGILVSYVLSLRHQEAILKYDVRGNYILVDF